MKDLFIKEIRNVSNDLGSMVSGKALFHKHFGEKLPKKEEILSKPDNEKWKIYTELRQFFENITGELSPSDSFYRHYVEEADFHFDRLYKEWKL
jgi:hypothetical protein